MALVAFVLRSVVIVTPVLALVPKSVDHPSGPWDREV